MTHEQDETSAYVAHRLKQLRDGKGVPRMTQIQMATRGGISTAQISDLIKGNRSAGKKTMRAAAKILDSTWSQLEEEAQVWARKQPTKSTPRPAPGSVDAPERWAEIAPRYPNLTEAIRIKGQTWLLETRSRLLASAEH